MSFRDEDFEQARAQLDAPDLAGYEPYVEYNGFTIHRRLREGSALYEYKVVGTLPTVDVPTCLAVYTDHEYRRTWDEYLVDVKRIPDTDGGLYARVALPWPLANRDYVYFMKTKTFGEGDAAISVILGQSSAHPAFPEVKGVVRVVDYAQSLVLRKLASGGSQVFMAYFDDPRGSIPTSIINWAAKKGVPAFLDKMEKACLKYASERSSSSTHKI